MSKLQKSRDLIGLVRSFFSSDIAVYSGSMSFMTIFSFIPLLMLAFFVAVYIPFVQLNIAKIIDFLYTNMTGTSADAITAHIVEFLQNSKKLGAFGLVFAIYSSYVFIKQLDFCIQSLKSTKQIKFGLKRYFIYLFAIFIMIISISISATYQVAGSDLDLMPLLTEYIQFVVALFMIYILISPIKYPIKKAFYNAVIYAVVFIAFKKLFVLYALNSSAYTTIYGSFSMLFIFFLWLNISWYLFFVSFKSYMANPFASPKRSV